eukprot:CAMPEP_0182913016 /NCGR_PEP_ID=MMETSP0034_2-20130328/37817_1 /TAXON_ID=156128 /ORGANISM="Nephroselmis pyriformis, Strain CCMP717" /LENGTH=265 /DNA_ID=CAMNT_0025049715 /DNA_START=21 /DNA_END=818 /DNA_ORIENTATION=+
MAALMSSITAKPFVGKQVVSKANKASVARGSVVVQAADRPLWFPGAAPPAWLDGSKPGDRGFDPFGFGKDPVAMAWYKQSELQHARWAMLGVAGVLGQELIHPDIFFYTAALPENMPNLGNPAGLNPAALLAIEFCLMHWVEVRRWQDYKNPGSVNQDPIFTGNSVPNTEMGYPGGIFDPFNFAKGDMAELQTKELKNGRLAMVAFAGFIIQAQATGEGPVDNLLAHIADPFHNNFATNIGACVIPDHADVLGLSIPTPCLWPQP